MRMPEMRAGRLRLETVLERLTGRNRLLRDVRYTVHLPCSELGHAVPVDGRSLRQVVAHAHTRRCPLREHGSSDRARNRSPGSCRPSLPRRPAKSSASRSAHGEVVQDLSRRVVCGGHKSPDRTIVIPAAAAVSLQKSLRVRWLFMFRSARAVSGCDATSNRKDSERSVSMSNK